MNPSVLFVSHVGVTGGGELSLLDIVRHRAGSSKVLLFADGPFRERLEQSEVMVEVLSAPRTVSSIRREGSGIRELQAVPGVFKLSSRVAQMAQDYDVLYANSQKALVISALAGKLAKKPVIWHQRDPLIAEHFSGVHRRLVVALANHLVTQVIANSKATVEAMVKSGAEPERVSLVYNGLDPLPFDAVAPHEVKTLRQRLGVSGVPVIGAFSRLAPWKGQHVLLEALSRLPTVHALLVGEAIFGERTYAESLYKQARNLGVADRVHFLGFRDDIPQLMRLVDVVVHTSVAPEPFGRVVVEGMLARSPVVATRAGGTTELIEDGVSGVLVPPEDAKALAEALSGLLAHPAKARDLAEVGYMAAIQRFSLQAMLEGVEQQIQEVAALWQQ